MVTPPELLAEIHRAKKANFPFVYLKIPTHRFPPPGPSVGSRIEVSTGLFAYVADATKDSMGRDVLILRFVVGELEEAMSAALGGEKPSDVMPETHFRLRNEGK